MTRKTRNDVLPRETRDIEAFGLGIHQDDRNADDEGLIE